MKVVGIQRNPITITKCVLKREKYECVVVIDGEVKSQVLPQFSVQISELQDPDSPLEVE